MTLHRKVLAFTGLMALGALAAVGYALHTMQPLHDYRFWVLLVLAMATARLKMTLPGLTGISIDRGGAAQPDRSIACGPAILCPAMYLQGRRQAEAGSNDFQPQHHGS